MKYNRFVRVMAVLLLAAACLSSAACRRIADYVGQALEGIQVTLPETDGGTPPPASDSVTQSPETEPSPLPPAYVYAPDPNEAFPDEASRMAARRADGAIGEGYHALNAYPDRPDIRIEDYDAARHPAAYASLSESRRAIYDTVYSAVSAFDTFSYIEKQQPKGFITDFLTANDALSYDHPEIFAYYRMKFKGGETTCAYYMPGGDNHVQETDVGRVRAAYEVYERVFDRIINGIPADLSNYQKCVYLCTVISSLCTYDYTQEALHDGFSPYGTLVKGQSVCQGYAETFMHLAWAAGIECDRTWGEVSGNSHVWNRVQTSAGELYIDPTWTDNYIEKHPGEVMFTDRYFLMEYEELAEHGYEKVTNRPDFLIDFSK